MRIVLYGNGGSGNHGCEAIARGTVELLGDDENTYLIHSDDVNQDKQYGLDQLASLEGAKTDIAHDFRFFSSYIKLKLFHDYSAMDIQYYLYQIREASKKVDVALSVGGDNYCYGNTAFYAALNKEYHKAGLKTVLWGCSIEPSILNEKKTREDLQRYDAIVARESITFDAIKKFHRRVILAPDPAFLMKPADVCVKALNNMQDVVGMNLSPMIISNETHKGITYANYRNLIEYILNITNFRVMLIPHVVWASNDDREVLGQLYREFRDTNRVLMIEDQSAPMLKSYISRCRIFIGARTHATIAAYSSCIPTLAVGYSVKARGIAKDLFGDTEHYVIPVQSLCEQDDLVRAFQWISDHETEIRNHLEGILPLYLKRKENAISALQSL